MQELEGLYRKVCKNLEMATEILGIDDAEEIRKMADRIWEVEEEVDELRQAIRQRHIQRLCEGTCDPAAGIVYVTVLANFERISDHCTNIAEDARGPLQVAEERRDAPG